MNIIKTGNGIAPPRVLIYGPEGIGKSSFAAQAKAIFIQTEDGLNNIEADSFPLAKTFKEVADNIQSLLTEDHKYKVVALDSVDWLERLIMTEVCRLSGKTAIEDLGYGKGWIQVGEIFYSTLAKLNKLREEKGMAIILIAHARMKTFQDPAGESYDRYEPNLSKQVSPLAREWADDVLFANFRVIKKTNEKDKRVVAATSERIIFSSDKPSFLAKTRSGIPEELPLDWKVYATARREARAKSNNNEVK